MITHTYSQGEAPTVFYVWAANTRIARVTGKNSFTVKMDCGITLNTKFDNAGEAAEAAARFYFDNFFLDIIEGGAK